MFMFCLFLNLCWSVFQGGYMRWVGEGTKTSIKSASHCRINEGNDRAFIWEIGTRGKDIKRNWLTPPGNSAQRETSWGMCPSTVCTVAPPHSHTHIAHPLVQAVALEFHYRGTMSKASHKSRQMTSIAFPLSVNAVTISFVPMPSETWSKHASLVEQLWSTKTLSFPLLLGLLLRGIVCALSSCGLVTGGRGSVCNWLVVQVFWSLCSLCVLSPSQ